MTLRLSLKNEAKSGTFSHNIPLTEREPKESSKLARTARKGIVMTTLRNTIPVGPHSRHPRIPPVFRLLAAASFAIFLPLDTGQAAFHLWDVNEVYSSADGTVQFIELRA